MAQRHPRTDSLPKARNGVISVPAGAPSWITEDLVRETIRVWQPFYPDPLTTDDALAIIQSAARLFEFLSREPEL